MFKCLFILATALLFTACTINGPRIEDHGFEFDAVLDSPETEILDYRYGDSNNPGARPPEWILQNGKVAQTTGAYGPMLVGDFLYVKWKIKNIGIVYQDTIDLRQHLSSNIKDHIVRFLIKDAKINVYIISMKKLYHNLCMLNGDPRKLEKYQARLMTKYLRCIVIEK